MHQARTLLLLILFFVPALSVHADDNPSPSSLQDVLNARNRMLEAQNRGDMEGMEKGKQELDETLDRYEGPGGRGGRQAPAETGPSLWQSVKNFFGFGGEKKESIQEIVERRNEQIRQQTEGTSGAPPQRAPVPQAAPPARTPPPPPQPQTPPPAAGESGSTGPDSVTAGAAPAGASLNSGFGDLDYRQLYVDEKELIDRENRDGKDPFKRAAAAIEIFSEGHTVSGHVPHDEYQDS